MTDSSNVWQRWVESYRLSMVRAMREFGMELTPDEVERMVQEDMLAVMRQRLREVFRRMIDGMGDKS